HHFALQHEQHVADAPALFEQVEDQRRGNVVGQVADDAHLAGRAVDGGEVELEDVGLVQHEAAVAGEAHAQGGREIAVQFDGGEAGVGAQQRPGEGALAGADFHQAFAAARRDGADDAVDDAVVVQEVLAETLARPVRGVVHQRASRQRRPISRAAATAVARLPGSARPVPARSSAVPWSTEVRTMGRPRVMLTALPKPLYLSTGRPWSWYMASTASAPARTCGVKRVSAGSGPVRSRPAVRSAPSAGMMTSISSRPRWPPSPACGLRPLTRMRGRAMPNLPRRSSSRMR